MIILFDLQEHIKDFAPGIMPENPYLIPNNEQIAKINIVESDGAKTVFIEDRTSNMEGMTVNMPSFEGLQPGDRLTVTGRIPSGAPKTDWGMVIHRGGEGYAILEQHRIPAHDGLYYMTYLLDAIDFEHPIRIRTNHWGNEEAHMDFFVDDILITRDPKNTDAATETRDVVYSFEENGYSSVNLEFGAISEYLQKSGEPDIELLDGAEKRIHIRRRVNDWDGVDIHVDRMRLRSGNKYTIHVEGRVEGDAPQGAQLMFQIIPGYVWRDNKNVIGGEEFSLTHKFSGTEVKNTEVVRVTSNHGGAKMSFSINKIEVKTV